MKENGRDDSHIPKSKHTHVERDRRKIEIERERKDEKEKRVEKRVEKHGLAERHSQVRGGGEKRGIETRSLFNGPAGIPRDSRVTHDSLFSSKIAGYHFLVRRKTIYPSRTLDFTLVLFISFEYYKISFFYVFFQ